MTLSSLTTRLQSQLTIDLSTLTKQQLLSLYHNTITCIQRHNELYYQKESPIISDKERDELFAFLQNIEAEIDKKYPDEIQNSSPSRSFSSQLSVQSSFSKAKHKTRMVSLANSYDANDLIDFDQRVQNILHKITTTSLSSKEKNQKKQGPVRKYLIEPKFDGLRIDLIYHYGHFHQAITRGDGITGEDVTANIKTLHPIYIPPILKHKEWHQYERVSFGGEVLVSKQELININKQREQQEYPPYANTRNLASGSLKQLDPNVTKARNLQCYIYEYCISDTHPSTTNETTTLSSTHHTWKTYDFSCLGFQTFSLTDKTYTIEEVVTFCLNPDHKQQLLSQNIDFDGLVIKLADNHLRELIGHTEHHPRRAIAYKFPAQQIAAQIRSVDRQVGRTGIITPVANITPTILSGATIKRVSLHNMDVITSKDIHINDRVRVQRSGEVIPYIVGVIKERRASVQPIIGPQTCPSCVNEIVYEHPFFRCINTDCSAQLVEKIKHFVSRDAMNIEGIGESMIQLLVQNKILTKLTDIYTLSDPIVQSHIKTFEGFGDKKLYNIIQSLEKSKTNELRRVIHALGIPHIGKKTAKDLTKAIRTNVSTSSPDQYFHYLIEQLTDQSFLASIHGIGIKTIEECIKFVEQNTNTFTELQAYGVTFDLNVPIKTQDAKILTGISFSITGTFPVNRNDIIQAMEEQGAEFDTMPKKTTNYMLIGEKPGSKAQKAKNLGIPTLENLDALTRQFPFLQKMLISSTTQKERGLFG